jgi:hypothetical protein
VVEILDFGEVTDGPAPPDAGIPGGLELGLELGLEFGLGRGSLDGAGDALGLQQSEKPGLAPLCRGESTSTLFAMFAALNEIGRNAHCIHNVRRTYETDWSQVLRDQEHQLWTVSLLHFAFRVEI